MEGTSSEDDVSREGDDTSPPPPERGNTANRVRGRKKSSFRRARASVKDSGSAAGAAGPFRKGATKTEASNLPRALLTTHVAPNSRQDIKRARRGDGAMQNAPLTVPDFRVEVPNSRRLTGRRSRIQVGPKTNFGLRRVRKDKQRIEPVRRQNEI